MTSSADHARTPRRGAPGSRAAHDARTQHPGAPGTPATRDARTLHPGSGSGAVLALDLPLSFWGGVGEDGTIIDRHHPQVGTSVTGRVLAMTSGRGSSSSSSVLAELLRSGAGPAAIVLTEADAIVTLGAIVATELYGTQVPVVTVTPKVLAALVDGERLSVEADPGGGACVRSWPLQGP